MAKQSMQKSIIFLMPLGIGFWMDFGGFGYQNGFKLVPKWDQKSISTLKAENQLNASRLAFSWLSGVEVGSKNRTKIDPKMESKMECILASIFERFWWILGGKLGSKIKQKSIQKGIEKVMKKRRSPRWQKSRSKTLGSFAAPRFQDAGEVPPFRVG